MVWRTWNDVIPDSVICYVIDNIYNTGKSVLFLSVISIFFWNDVHNSKFVFGNNLHGELMLGKRIVNLP